MPQAQKSRKIINDIKLDRSRHYTQSIGEGAHEYPFFQNGYYFDNDGDMLDCEHNRQRLKDQQVGKVNEGDMKVQGGGITPKDQVREQLNARLSTKSNEEIFALATTLKEKMVEKGETTDYTPVLEARTDNTNFILDNAE